MYIPSSFKVSDIALIAKFIEGHGFGMLISSSDGGVDITHVPFIVKTAGEEIILESHVALRNPQHENRDTKATVVFQGPHAYISPEHYTIKQSVPTWDYIAVHIEGVVSFCYDHEIKKEMLEEFIGFYDKQFAARWIDYDEEYKNRMISGIVGLRIKSTKVEACFKLSQNKPQADRVTIIDHLNARPDFGYSKKLADYISKTLADD